MQLELPVILYLIKMKLTNVQKNWLQFVAIVIMIIAVCSGCNSKKTAIEQIDTMKVDSSFADTVGNKYTADAGLFELSREYNIALDSLELMRDSISKLNVKLIKLSVSKDSVVKLNVTNREKLGIAEYKLLRIREYNRIAAQGNNIKFLRGWIARTINK